MLGLLRNCCIWAFAWFTVEVLYVVCARFTVKMFCQLVWAYAWFTAEMLYGLMLGLLRKCCMLYDDCARFTLKM